METGVIQPARWVLTTRGMSDIVGAEAPALNEAQQLSVNQNIDDVSETLEIPLFPEGPWTQQESPEPGGGGESEAWGYQEGPTNPEHLKATQPSGYNLVS